MDSEVSITARSNPQNNGLDRLTGKHVRLWPYAPGYYSRDLVYRLWRIVEDEKAIPLTFWGRFTVLSETPIETRGDLMDFARILATTNGVLLIVTETQTDALAGFIWFEEIVPKYKAVAGIFMRQKYWGDPATEAGRLGERYAFETLDLQSLWAITPWQAAINYCKRIGFKPIALLPDFALINGRERDVTFLRITRGEFNG